MGLIFYFIIFGLKLDQLMIVMPHVVQLKQVITCLFSSPYYHVVVNFGMVLFVVSWIKSDALNFNLYRFAPNLNEQHARRLRRLFIKQFELIPCCLILIVSGYMLGFFMPVFIVMMAAVVVFIISPALCLIYALAQRMDWQSLFPRFSNRS